MTKCLIMLINSLRKIISAKSFKSHFGSLEGEQLKTAPKGFDKEDPAVDLLRYKQLIVSQQFDNKYNTSEELASEIVKSYKAMRPFFDYMSEKLTTNLNGESTIQKNSDLTDTILSNPILRKDKA